MAGPARECDSGVTDADRRNFDFVDILLRISDSLSKEETANIKLYCMHLIPKGKAEKLRRAVDVFHVLIERGKIDQENLDFVKELLERLGRQDLIRDVLLPFQPPDREIPESPELQPGTSADEESEDGTTTSNTYVVVHGQVRMIQETLDRLKNNLASLSGTKRSQVKFRGYKKYKSILVHFSIPRDSTPVLRHMAQHCDPRLVYMGAKSLQIDAEVPIKITQKELIHDVQRRHTMDDIEVGSSTPTKHPKVPKTWSRLSALNLFSDALPLHLQVAESLEYQGFSYSLVQALVQKDQEREHKMKQVIHSLKKAEMDSKTLMTMRSKLTIAENRLKEALETNAVLEKELQQAREYTEKVTQQATSHVTEYKGEKPPGGWSAQIEKTSFATQTHPSERKRPEFVQAEGSTRRTIGDPTKSKVTYGGRGSGPGKFQYPRGIVVSPSNDVFVVDRDNKHIQVHNTAGVYLRHFPTVVPGEGDKSMKPHDVSMDGDGTLWVAGRGDTADHVVQYNLDGVAMKQFDLPTIKYMRAIAVDMRNNDIIVTIADEGRCIMKAFRPDGSLVRRFEHPETEIRVPRFITVDREGNILVVDRYTDYVDIYDESGKFLLKFGGRGRDDGQLRSPHGICTDSFGHIIVADSLNRRLQIFTSNGEYVRQIQTGPSLEGLTVGSEGWLVLTNWDDHSVTVFPSY